MELTPDILEDDCIDNDNDDDEESPINNGHQDKHDKPYVCGICSKAFAKSKGLDRHVTKVHDTAPQQKPKRHTSNAHKDMAATSFEADIEDDELEYDNQGDYKVFQHLSIWFFVKSIHNFQDLCDEEDLDAVIKTEEEIKRAKQSKLDKISERLRCDECQLITLSREDLIMHIKEIHKNDDPYFCPIT